MQILSCCWGVGQAVHFHCFWFRVGMQEPVGLTALQNQLLSSSKHSHKSCRMEIAGLCSPPPAAMCYYVAVQKWLLEGKVTSLSSKGLQKVSVLRSSICVPLPRVIYSRSLLLF